MAATKGAAKSAAPSRSKNGSKPKKVAAAEAELDPPEVRTVEFEGITLTLAQDPPPTLLWDIAAAQNNILAYFQLAQSLIAPEQLADVRAKLGEYGGAPGDYVVGLVDAIFGAYGLGLGESSASQES